MKQITVLLAEDHMIVREGFRKLLAAEADIEVVGEAQTGRQAVEMARKLRPEVIVMDIGMPVLNGLEATRQIRQAIPSTKVIILSAYNDDPYVEQAIAFGAAGYLIKQTSCHDLSKAIREVHNGRAFFSPSIAKRFENQKSTVWGQTSRKRVARLTSRELDVLQRIAEGAPNKQVAVSLSISTKTVEKHRQNLMRKLNIHDVASLTRYAIGAGIIESKVALTIV